MELDKLFVKEQVLTIPGLREAMAANDYDKVFELCGTTRKRNMLARSLWGAGIKFLDHMTEIPDSLFRGADNINGIVIPGNIKVIGDLAFFNSSVSDVVFKDGIEVIGDGAFSQTNLKEAHLPKSIKQIGQNALGRAKVFCFLTHDDLTLSDFAYAQFTKNTITNEETGEDLRER